MPRNRDARIAVLGSRVQRPAAYGQSTARSRALRRRVVVVGLVLVSLALLTASFRSTTLDPLEGYGASALRPFEIAANHVARPFRDATSWLHGVVNAKSQNAALRQKVDELNREVATLKGVSAQNTSLRQLLKYYQSPSFPSCCTIVGADVLTSPTPLSQTITISAGANAGIAVRDVVVSGQGLVGLVDKVFSDEAEVTLITDPASDVRAVDESNPQAIGLIDHGVGSNTLIFDQIAKDLVVNEGDTIVTAGSAPGAVGAEYPSLYPRGIRIGIVSSESQNDTDIYKDIEVQPFVDFSSLESVLVLIPKPTTTTRRGRR